jgi:hypothetical protein
MRRRTLPTLLGVAAWLLVAAAPANAAGAHDNGEGLLGETTDKLVTFFSLGVVIFFAAFVVVMSLIQHVLEKRHHDEPSVRQRVGW